MSGFNRRKAVDLILSGEHPMVAIAKAAIDSEPDNETHIRWIIQPAGRLANLPDPACVAARLSRIESPTRQDIERALDECSRGG